MISANSEELSKSEREGGESTPQPGPCVAEAADCPAVSPGQGQNSRLAASIPARFAGPKKHWVLPALLLVIAFGLIAGPTILLNLILKNMFPAESGLTLTYDRARAGFLFGSASVEGIRLVSLSADPARPSLAIASVHLDGVSPRNLFSLSRSPEEPPSAPLYLAREVAVKGLTLDGEMARGSVSELKIRDLLLTQGGSLSALPAMFDRLEARDLKLNAAGPFFEQTVELSQLEAHNLSGEILGALRIKLLSFNHQDAENTENNLNFNLNGLTAGGLKLAALKQALKSHYGTPPWWWLVAGCDTLDLARAEMILNRRNAITIESASYDFSTSAPGLTSFSRQISFIINAANLAEATEAPLWNDLSEICGEICQGSLALGLDYARAQGLAELKSARLNLKDLGHLDLSGRFSGVSAAKAHYSHYQILFDANTWRLGRLSLDFENQGLVKNIYRYLNRHVLSNVPGASVETKIMDYIINPNIYEMERSGRLTNLAAIRNEAEAFIRQPKSLRLVSAPDSPYNLLSLANIDKYDIIDKLHLTIEVDQRAPVLVAVEPEPRPGLNPPPPQPLDKGLDLPFSEDGII